MPTEEREEPAAGILPGRRNRRGPHLTCGRPWLASASCAGTCLPSLPKGEFVIELATARRSISLLPLPLLGCAAEVIE